MIGISNEPESTIRQFVQDQDLTFPVLRDNQSVYTDYYIPGGISPYPRDFIIDSEGKVRYANTEYDINKMIAVIQSLKPEIDLEEPKITPAPPVDEEPEDTNEKTLLLQNYPNPFSGVTSIPFHLSRGWPVTLSIYDIQGKLIKKIVTGYKDAGDHTLVWDATNSQDSPVSSGLYIYELATPTKTIRKKLIVVR